MQITDKEHKIKHRFIMDLWNMIKQFDVPEDTDAYWDALIETSGRIADKYEAMSGGTDHTYRLVCLAFITAKERQLKALERRAAS